MFNQRNLTYYAYSPVHQNKSSNKEKRLKFANLEKGFYDDIIITETNIKKTKRHLENVKESAIKESIYANKSIPSDWKTKLTYRGEVCNSIKKDDTFAKFLGKESDLDNINKINTFLGVTSDSSRKIIRLPGLENTLKESIDGLQNKQDEQHPAKRTIKKLTRMMTYIPPQHTGAHFMSEKEIASKLDDYKSKYDMNKYIESLRSITKDDINYSLTEPDVKKRNATISSSLRIRNTKPKVLKSSIYINLIPKNEDKERINSLPNEGYKTKGLSQFLNVAGEEKIEITNPKIKRELEIIDYYGPRYTYCKSCHNKNLEFYQNFETNQCLKLLSYLKKERISINKKYK